METLDRLAASGAPSWVPPAGERETAGFEDDEFLDSDPWLTPEMRRRDFTDAMIAGLRDDDVSNELFEGLAMRGEDAEELLVEEDSAPDMPAPLYSTRWVRVPDNVFEQYAPLSQRREIRA